MAENILLAQFDDPSALLNAASKINGAGFKQFDCHSPFPIHGLSEVMGLKRSILPVIVGSFAAIGLIGAFSMAYWMSAIDYPLIISGKPYNSYQAYTPVVFAVAVLLAAISAFVGTLALNGLLRYNNPLFSTTRFEKFSDDGFFISIGTADPQFDLTATSEFIKSIGGKNIEVIET
jgi:hypothetical protein